MVIVPLVVAAIDPTTLPVAWRILPTKHGKVSGNFTVVVEGVLYVAMDNVMRGGNKVRLGVCYVYDDGASTQTERRYQAYNGLYRVIRAYLTYAKGWAVMNMNVLGDMRTMTSACLAHVLGLPSGNPGDIPKLNVALQDILTAGGEGFTTNKQVRHAIAVFKRTQAKTRRGSQVLGFAHSDAKIADRLEEVRRIHNLVVSIGTIVSRYLDAVLAEVRKARMTINRIMASSTDALMEESTAGVLQAVARTLRTVLVARPCTHVAVYAQRDCSTAAAMIRTARTGGGAAMSGASEGVRNIVGNVRDSLDLLLWQYDLEQLTTLVAGASRAKIPLTPEEWAILQARVRGLCVRVREPFGAQFRNKETMPLIRDGIDAALVEIRRLKRVEGLHDLVTIHTRFVEISNRV